MEHRSFTRLPVSVATRVKARGNAFEGLLTSDISLAGMAVNTGSWRLGAMEFVELALDLAPYSQGELRLKGMVIHSDGNRAGIMLTEDNPEYVNAVIRLMAATKPESIQLQRYPRLQPGKRHPTLSRSA